MKIKPSKELIEGVRAGLQALRDAHVEPMVLSITPHDGTFGWQWCKFKALPGHPNHGNAGHGWSHPTEMSAFAISKAPNDWPQGGSFPRDVKCTLNNAKEFCTDLAKQIGIPLDFTVECAWREPEDHDMTKPGAIGKLSEIDIERGGAMVWDYYPSSEDEISYIKSDGSGEPVDPEKEERTRSKFRSLKKKEHESTDAYMAPPAVTDPLTVFGAWYVDSVSGGIVAELENGKLISFPISPYQAVTADSADVYTGLHPRRQHGIPLPEALYPYYGLVKSDETLSKVLPIRLSPSEMNHVKEKADAAGKTVSEFVRGWIRNL